MNIFKKGRIIPTIIILVILILIMIIFFVSATYNKKSDVINQYKSEGWVVVSITYNNFNIYEPWTIFAKTRNVVTFVKPNEIEELDNGYIVAKVLQVVFNYQNTGDMNFFTPNNIYDCINNKQSGFIGDIAPEDINYETLVWYEYYEDVVGYETGYEIIQRICDFKQ